MDEDKQFILIAIAIYTIIFALIAHFQYVSESPEGEKTTRILKSIAAYFLFPMIVSMGIYALPLLVVM